MESRNTVLAGMTIVDAGQLYRRLLELVTNADLRRQMGERAARTARERYDWSTIIPRYEALFTDLLDRTDHTDRADHFDGHLPDSGLGGPLTYDVQRIFAHYPCRVLDTGMRVSLSARGQEWLSSRFPLSTQPDFPIDDTDVRDVLQTVADADTATPPSLQRLIDTLTETHPAIGATWVVSRLLKYGLLQIAQDEQDAQDAMPC